MFSFLPNFLLQSSYLQTHLLSMGSGPSMNWAMSSRVMFVSSIDALTPGSRFRSEIDIRLGESSVFVGEEQPVPGWDDGRIGILAPIVGLSFPISPNRGVRAPSERAWKESSLAVNDDPGDA